jgi:hypothetical protein
MLCAFAPLLPGTPLGAGSTAAQVVTPAAPDGLRQSALRVHRTGGFTPYRELDYAIVVRANTPVAYQTKELLGYSEPLQRLALLTWEEYGAIWSEIEKIGGLQAIRAAADAPPSKDRAVARWVVTVELAGETVERAFVGELWELPPPIRGSIEAVAAGIRSRTGAMPFRNVFVTPSKRGWVDVESRPVARVWLDGRDTGENTPLLTYELPAGEHTLRLVSEEHGLDRTYTFRVDAGITTLLNLDLF